MKPLVRDILVFSLTMIALISFIVVGLILPEPLGTTKYATAPFKKATEQTLLQAGYEVKDLKDNEEELKKALRETRASSLQVISIGNLDAFIYIGLFGEGESTVHKTFVGKEDDSVDAALPPRDVYWLIVEGVGLLLYEDAYEDPPSPVLNADDISFEKTTSEGVVFKYFRESGLTSYGFWITLGIFVAGFVYILKLHPRKVILNLKRPRRGSSEY